MAARDIKIGTALDAASWAKGAIFAAATTPPGSPERRRKLDEIALGVARAKQAADSYRGKMAAELRIALSIAELGISKLRARPSKGPAPDVDAAESRPGKQKRSRPRLRGTL